MFDKSGLPQGELGGRKIARRRRIGPSSELLVRLGKGSIDAQVIITTARGDEVAYPVELREDDLADLDGVTLWQDKPGIEKMLRALASVGSRPSDYGTDRATLDNLVETGNVQVLLAHVPVARAIGRAKVVLSPQDLGDALAALSTSSIGRAIVLSLAGGEGPTRTVGARVPVALHAAIAAEAERRGESVNAVLIDALSKQFLKR